MTSQVLRVHTGFVSLLLLRVLLVHTTGPRNKAIFVRALTFSFLAFGFGFLKAGFLKADPVCLTTAFSPKQAPPPTGAEGEIQEDGDAPM